MSNCNACDQQSQRQINVKECFASLAVNEPSFFLIHAERLGSMLNLSHKHPSQEWPCEQSRTLSTTTVEKFRAEKFVDCRVGFEAVWASGARLPVAGQ